MSEAEKQQAMLTCIISLLHATNIIDKKQFTAVGDLLATLVLEARQNELTILEYANQRSMEVRDERN